MGVKGGSRRVARGLEYLNRLLLGMVTADGVTDGLTGPTVRGDQFL